MTAIEASVVVNTEVNFFDSRKNSFIPAKPPNTNELGDKITLERQKTSALKRNGTNYQVNGGSL